MKRPFSPLVWLCAAGTLTLGALTLCDPSGVYAGYVDALDRNTPIIAAVFTAAQDGVYPWTPRAEDDVSPRGPAYRPLTETVTDEEMRSSVGNDEPFSENASARPDEPAAVTPPADPAAPVSDGGSGADANTSSDVGAGVAANAPPQVSSGFVTVDESWFDDALFIGDSHIEGFCDYAGVRNATYYFKRGLDIWSVMNKSFVGGKQTIPQALSQRQFGKIYIMLGINEIGRGTTESYAAQYADVVAQLRELQPEALIYIQSIFHTSQKKSDSSIYNNDTINARNAAISALADGQHVFFVDCNVVFDDENGALTSTYSGDGVHVKAPYYTMWRDYLLRFGLSGVATADAPGGQGAAPPIPVSAPAPTQPAEPAPASASVKPDGESAAGQPENGAAAESGPSTGEEATAGESTPTAPKFDPTAPDAVPNVDADVEPDTDTGSDVDPDAAEATPDVDVDSDVDPAEASDPVDAESASASPPDLPEPDTPTAAESVE